VRIALLLLRLQLQHAVLAHVLLLAPVPLVLLALGSPLLALLLSFTLPWLP